MDAEQLGAIPGVGRAIQDKILELASTGTMATLEKYLDMTPDGIVDMLQIKGFGPKKVLTVWKDLGVESAGELLYAVNENRLLDLKGFGKKTQDNLKIQLEYHLESAGKMQFAQAEEIGNALIQSIRDKFPKERIEFTGAFYRKDDIIEEIDLISSTSAEILENYLVELEDVHHENGKIKFKGLPLKILEATTDNFENEWLKPAVESNFPKRC